jgi:selenocysteine-specific elongation factor
MGNEMHTNLALGTAGHIDHGKSSLVMALTGVDPDRLEEEKKRGITIELGFVELSLPDGRKMTVVDVPGHERFVRQMIIGAAGIDVALLVIAADDGIMPQTTEHVAVLQTLGIKTCVVALTKIDMVDKEWVDMVEDDVRQFLANTPYADARIVRCSSRTGEGVEDVRRAIADACDEAPEPVRSAALRQPVHRVFSVRGAGTVVTGVVWDGTVKPDDVVEVLPLGKRARVRSVQVYGESVEEAVAGNCVAINLGDVKADEIKPGDFIASPGIMQPTDRFDCYFTYVDTAGSGKPLTSGVQMHIAHGAKEVLGRVLFADGLTQLGSGQSCYAQIRLDEPMTTSCYDRFIARTYSPVRVAGGGQILLAHPKRRTNLEGEERAVLDALRESDFQAALELELGAQRYPRTSAELAYLFGIDGASAQTYLMAAVDAGKADVLGTSEKYYIAPHVLDLLLDTIEQVLVAFHEEHPTEPGLKKETLRQRCFPHLEAQRFDILVRLAVSQERASVNRGLVGYAKAQEAANRAEEEAEAKLLAYLTECDRTPPELKVAARENDLNLPLARRAIANLKARGKVYQVTRDTYYESACLEGMRKVVAELCSQGDGATLSDIRDALGISRKAAVALLDAFDLEEFTVRVEDRRVLR